MMSFTVRIAAVVAAAAAALIVSSCSSPAQQAAQYEERSGHPDASGTVTLNPGAPAAHNADDITFATDMIPHHDQAVELSALVTGHSNNTDLIALAERISAAQQPEVQTLKAFLVQWKETPESDTGHAGHHSQMQGMVDEATIARLQTLNGVDFDTLWLQSMISHHQGAVEMAKAQIANGENGDAIGVAKKIVETQQAEISQMKQMLGSGAR
jgi:uncharacterized protein (DUF305 family)